MLTTFQSDHAEPARLQPCGALRSFALLLFCFGAAEVGWAQKDTGSMVGTVKEPHRRRASRCEGNGKRGRQRYELRQLDGLLGRLRCQSP